ncbi:MAG: PEP-CTERM sorting domain-containing protein [Lentisphaeria bacterium]
MNKQTLYCAVVSTMLLMALTGAVQAEIITNGIFGTDGGAGDFSGWTADSGTPTVGPDGNCITTPRCYISSPPGFGQISQTTDWVIGTGEHYAFSMDTFRVLAATFSVALYADDLLGTRTILASADYPSVGTGWEVLPYYASVTPLSYDVPSASAYIGQRLGVQIGASGWGGAVDNVSVTVPEPSALMMLGISLTGLLGSARRKRT